MGGSDRDAPARFVAGRPIPAALLRSAAMPLFPLVLGVHIVLAVGLFLPALLLPFALRTNRSVVSSRGTVVRGLLALQGTGSIVVGGGVAITGVLLVAALWLRDALPEPQAVRAELYDEPVQVAVRKAAFDTTVNGGALGGADGYVARMFM